jgi:hypothetical protein
MLYLKYHTLISLVNLGGGLMIKRLLFLSLVCFSLLSLSACSILPQSNTETETSAEKKKKKKKKKDSKKNTGEEDEEDDGEEEIDNSDFAFLDFDVSKEFISNTQPAIIYDKLILKNDGYDKLAQSVDTFNNKVKTSFLNNSGETYHKNGYIISRADNKVVSVFAQEDLYTESVKYFLSSATYDSETGKDIALSDIINLDFDFDEIYSDFDFDSSIKDPNEFKSRIQNLINDEAQGKDDYKADNMTAWTLGYNGISIYTVAKLTSGQYYYDQVVQFDIPYSKYPELYNKKYMVKPDEFGFNIGANGEFYYDINGDGEAEHIRLSANIIDGDYNIEDYVINIDGDITTITAGDLAGYSIQNFIFIRFNNKNYLMFNESGDNDGQILRMLDLNTCEFAVNSEFEQYLSFPDYNSLIYNPRRMLLSNLIYTVSTFEVINMYEFSSDESFKNLNSSYEIVSSLIFTSKIDLQADVISDNGEVLERIDISTGTTFYPYATDSNSYTDYKLDDGRTVRLPMGYDDDHGHTINGMPVGDVFDGVVYAG